MPSISPWFSMYLLVLLSDKCPRWSSSVLFQWPSAMEFCSLVWRLCRLCTENCQDYWKHLPPTAALRGCLASDVSISWCRSLAFWCGLGRFGAVKSCLFDHCVDLQPWGHSYKTDMKSCDYGWRTSTFSCHVRQWQDVELGNLGNNGSRFC